MSIGKGFEDYRKDVKRRSAMKPKSRKVFSAGYIRNPKTDQITGVEMQWTDVDRNMYIRGTRTDRRELTLFNMLRFARTLKASLRSSIQKHARL